MRARLITAIFSLSVLSGCALFGNSSESTNALYDRLGGTPGIASIVDGLTANCVADPRINTFFFAVASDGTRLRKFKEKLVDQICETSGGPCTYAGKDMKTAHAGMGISDQHFSAFVENLVKAMEKLDISKGDQESLVGLLGPLRKDIVTHR